MNEDLSKEVLKYFLWLVNTIEPKHCNCLFNHEIVLTEIDVMFLKDLADRVRGAK